MVELMRSILELPKPVIARIDGHVRAGGFGLVSAADIAIGGVAYIRAHRVTSRAGTGHHLADRATAAFLPVGVALPFSPGKVRSEQAVEMGLLTAAADSGEGIDTVMSEVLDGIRKHRRKVWRRRKP